MQRIYGMHRRISERDYEAEIKEINEELLQMKKEYDQKIMQINSNSALTLEEKETKLRLLQYDCNERYSRCRKALEEINSEIMEYGNNIIEDRKRENLEQIELLYKAYVNRINNNEVLTTEQKNKRIEIVESVLNEKKSETDMQNKITEYECYE